MDPSTTWGEETEDAFSVKQLYLSLPCEVDSKFAAERGLFTNGDPKAALAAANSNNNGGINLNGDDNTIESADAKAAARALNPLERRPVPIFNIEHILSHFDKKTMYIFDIDETLVMSPPHQFRGLTTIENHLLLAAIDIFERTNNVTFLQYVQMFVEERYRERLDSKMLIEGRTTLDVLQRLQNAGCWVFGLTSRYAHSVSRTDEMLTRIGIDFSHSTPLPADLSLQDPGTQAVYARGVIYTNAVDKGVVLNRFLENVLLRHVLDEEEKRKSRGEASSPNSNNGSAPSSPQGPRVFKEGEFFSLDSAASQDAKLQVPSSIVFIDDRISNVESILTGVPLADRLGIAIHGYHYLAASLERECDPNDKASAVPLPYDLDAHNSVEVMMEQLIYVRNQLTDPDTLKCVEALMKELRRPGFGRESSSVAASTSAPNLD